jgi:chromosomal replication initiation ATPase DnaA
MVLSNQNLNTFLTHLAIKHNIDLPKEMSEFVVDRNPETNKEKIQFVFMAVSEISGISVGNLLGKNRKAEYTIWKHIARYICIINRYGSLSFIANEINHMDHSSLIHSRNLVNDLLDCNDRQMTECFNKVKHLINETNKEKKDANCIGSNS